MGKYSAYERILPLINYRFINLQFPYILSPPALYHQSTESRKSSLGQKSWNGLESINDQFFIKHTHKKEYN